MFSASCEHSSAPFSWSLPFWAFLQPPHGGDHHIDMWLEKRRARSSLGDLTLHQLVLSLESRVIGWIISGLVWDVMRWGLWCTDIIPSLKLIMDVCVYWVFHLQGAAIYSVSFSPHKSPVEITTLKKRIYTACLGTCLRPLTHPFFFPLTFFEWLYWDIISKPYSLPF